LGRGPSRAPCSPWMAWFELYLTPKSSLLALSTFDTSSRCRCRCAMAQRSSARYRARVRRADTLSTRLELSTDDTQHTTITCSQRRVRAEAARRSERPLRQHTLNNRERLAVALTASPRGPDGLCSSALARATIQSLPAPLPQPPPLLWHPVQRPVDRWALSPSAAPTLSHSHPFPPRMSPRGHFQSSSSRTAHLAAQAPQLRTQRLDRYTRGYRPPLHPFPFASLHAPRREL
jgi:hypothetical protein